MESSPETPAPTLTVSELQMNIWLLKNFHLHNKLLAMTLPSNSIPCPMFPQHTGHSCFLVLKRSPLWLSSCGPSLSFRPEVLSQPQGQLPSAPGWRSPSSTSPRSSPCFLLNAHHSPILTLFACVLTYPTSLNHDTSSPFSFSHHVAPGRLGFSTL